MSYCEISDVKHEFTPTLLRTMERDYGERLDENLVLHIEKAEAFVNASLSRAYSVPLRQASKIVISAECKIAAYFAGVAYSEKDKVLLDKYEIGREILENLVEADNPALVDEGLSASEQEKFGVFYGSDERIFTSEELSNW